ncbi:glycosyltransferase family 4 protein [Novosphingobium sp. MMS21-SN21R]|uniref:glycosyltransferase family 4 protein n=1 Tax=Novosphingobium sp. MMS21-SN21R TaxID=2969298 RepID=UPI00288447EE|nr:glycosyltransferase family 4 protein [Novosphingobium sp. MMS21-SN21R]MDT0506957.1 glycosyltransferase family 4 protein [Novosphingobium sp. MMS21-SN21R]
MTCNASPSQRIRVAHLLDDCSLGGVTRALGVFESEKLRQIADSSTIVVPPATIRAPRMAADVIVTHFPPNWRRLMLLAGLKLRNPEARIVHVEHSYTRAWEAIHVPSMSRFRAMLWLAMRLVDKVVCVSHAQAAWLQEAARIDAGRITVIHPYAENPGLADLPLPEPGERLRIGAYGRFCEQKGFDDLVAAFRSGWFPNCDLILGGFGEDEAKLRAMADGCPAIRFAGKVDDVAAFLRNCDVVAVPSRWEAYGMVANEAREAGRPVLVAPVDGLVEQAAGAGVVADFTDRESIEAALLGLRPARLKAVAHRARDTVRACSEVRQTQWAALLRSAAESQVNPKAAYGPK